MRSERRRGWWLWLALALGLAACGTPFGIYHEILPGQTIYRIARTYGVDPDRLMRLNRIDDPRLIQPGDRVFVPGADRLREVPVTAEPAETRPAPAARRSDRPAPSPAAGSGVETARIRETGPASSGRLPDGAPRLRWPVQGQVTDPFGPRNGRPHDGIDISAPAGTSVVAAADGRVIYSDNQLRGYGNMIIVRHEGCWATIYSHNRENLVAKGDFVTQGQVIARVGQTGRASGPHLHFELRCGKDPRDPMPLLDKSSARGP